MSKLTVQYLWRLWLLQTVLILIVVSSLWWVDRTASYSVLAGGLIFLIPNVYFALYAFRFRGAQAAQQVLLGFYRGEIGKFILSIVGFASVFTLVKPLDILVLFVSYIVLTIVQWVFLSKIG